MDDYAIGCLFTVFPIWCVLAVIAAYEIVVLIIFYFFYARFCKTNFCFLFLLLLALVCNKNSLLGMPDGSHYSFAFG